MLSDSLANAVRQIGGGFTMQHVGDDQQWRYWASGVWPKAHPSPPVSVRVPSPSAPDRMAVSTACHWPGFVRHATSHGHPVHALFVSLVPVRPGREPVVQQANRFDGRTGRIFADTSISYSGLSHRTSPTVDAAPPPSRRLLCPWRSRPTAVPSSAARPSASCRCGPHRRRAAR